MLAHRLVAEGFLLWVVASAAPHQLCSPVGEPDPQQPSRAWPKLLVVGRSGIPGAFCRGDTRTRVGTACPWAVQAVSLPDGGGGKGVLAAS